MSAIGSTLDLVSITRGSRAHGGSYVDWTYEGTRDAVNVAFSVNFPQVGVTINDLLVNKVGNNKWQLIIRRDDVLSGAVALSHQVRLITQRVHKSIFEPPLPGPLADVTDGEIAQIKEEIRQRSTDSFTQSPTWLADVSQGARDLYSLALRGVQHRIVYQPHLIKQSVGNNLQIWVVSFSNIGKLFSTADVVDDAAITSILRFGLPQDVSDFDDYEYGWLKHGPNVEPGPENVEILSQEYEYGLWSTKLYEFATP